MSHRNPSRNMTRSAARQIAILVGATCAVVSLAHVVSAQTHHWQNSPQWNRQAVPDYPTMVAVQGQPVGGNQDGDRCAAGPRSPLGAGNATGCRKCGCCAPRQVTGVDGSQCVQCGEPTWANRGPIPWEVFAHGEYIGPAREKHVPEYRLRVDDQLEMVYRLTREQTSQPYELSVGDRIRVESLSDNELDRELIVQSDGTIVLPFVGTVAAADRTIEELRKDLDTRYEKFYHDPSITVTPLLVNTKLEDLRATVDSRQGSGGQTRAAQVSPDGTIQLPALGPIPAHGLTLAELKREIDVRYASDVVEGIEVTPILTQRAPRFIYVVGEVAQPGRFELVAPTTVMESISLAGGWNVGANLRQVVIFRRGEDWRILATKVDIRGALYGKRPAPSDELWLRDSDVVLIPKSPIRVLDDAIRLVFTDGIYAAVPVLGDAFFYDAQTRL